MSKQTPIYFGAIHLGSETVGLQIVEYTSLHDAKVIERASRQVALGEETFKTGKISFSTASELCELLKGYRRLMTEFGVRDYRVAATTAIREAENQQYIIDQIKIRTGFTVEVVDMPQEIFFKYAALFKRIEEGEAANGQEGILFVDISSGGLGITLYKNGIRYQQNIHLGILRIKEGFNKQQRESVFFTKALDEYIARTITPVQEELCQHKIKHLVLSGTETRLLLSMLGREKVGELSKVGLKEFKKLYKQLTELNLPQIMERFNLTEHKAEIVLPTIVFYNQILRLTDAEEIIIASDNFIDGMTILHISEKTKDDWLEVIQTQLVSLAKTIGEKYKYDADHAGFVSRASLQIFDKMAKVHGLNKRAQLLLEVAAILEDIGKFVNLRRHYFYSYRLILSSDIVGFSEQEKQIMANVAYYHSKGTPALEDANFALLTSEQQVIAAKLIAIIRLADALDSSHRQKIQSFQFMLKGNELIIKVSAAEDISIEEWNFADKVHFFESVFGIKPILKQQ
jgi:exopolyphosphatase/guanosine-5'-triphosphate,3'-diphosphate pyrophosphatase